MGAKATGVGSEGTVIGLLAEPSAWGIAEVDM